MHNDHKERLALAVRSLEGLSLGDAFGQRVFQHQREGHAPPAGDEPPSGPWSYTDDTVMALSVVENLALHGAVDQDALAHRFGERYQSQPSRGYGAGTHDILSEIAAGNNWRTVASAVFNGTGSKGNGGAMRVAPIGAYFYDVYEDAAAQAEASAVITHTHAEGKAGAIAVAVATAFMARCSGKNFDPTTFFEVVLHHTPSSETRYGIRKAADMDLEITPITAAKALGNGSKVLAEDTVPFALWITARHPNDFKQSLWSTVAVGGDLDTNCAIVGGITILGDPDGIPASWLAHREPLPKLKGLNHP